MVAVVGVLYEGEGGVVAGLCELLKRNRRFKRGLACLERLSVRLAGDMSIGVARVEAAKKRVLRYVHRNFMVI